MEQWRVDPWARAYDAARRFMQEFRLDTDHAQRDYVVELGVTRRAYAEAALTMARHDCGDCIERAALQKTDEILRAGEDPNEPCIIVLLRQPLPKSLKLPEVFKGAFENYRVYSVVTDTTSGGSCACGGDKPCGCGKDHGNDGCCDGAEGEHDDE